MYIVGVTSCSTGIAHTYMAAEAIKKAAKKMGHKAKIETQGSIGIESKLSKKDLEEADLIIVATDVSMREPERLNGYEAKSYHCSTDAFIKNKEKALQQALDSLGVK